VTRFIVAAPSRIICWLAATDPGKRDLSYIRISHEFSAYRSAQACHDIKNAPWKIRVVHAFEQNLRLKRAQFIGLYDYRATGSQRGSSLEADE